MKKLILFLLVIFAGTAFGQGQLRLDGRVQKSIPQYDLSRGDTSYIIAPDFKIGSYQWSVTLIIDNLAGTNDGLVEIYQANDTGWVAYPDMPADSITANGAISFEDYYFTHDRLKVQITVNSITGGNLNIHQRLITSSKH